MTKTINNKIVFYIFDIVKDNQNRIKKMKKKQVNINIIYYFLFCISHITSPMLFAGQVQRNDTIIQLKDSVTRQNIVNRDLNIRIATELNPGLITYFDQAIAGKIAGVQIMTNNGSLTSGSFIQIRGISSLLNAGQLLIVVDGIPLETAYTTSNLANILNPDDIQEITVLKDAATVGAYGMRAANGVISITTRKGKTDRLRINFSSTDAIQQVTRTASVMSAAEFRSIINTQGTDAEKALLGNASTNWADEIFQTAPATDNHLSISGGLAKNIPFRVSLGYLNENGILKTENAEKYNGSLVINPSFFKNHLNISLNLRGSIMNNRIANIGAIGSAAAINPTVPVTSSDSAYTKYDGYWQPASTTFGTPNPVALLNHTIDKLGIISYFTNFGLDYKLHFFEDLHFYINYANYFSVFKDEKTVLVFSPPNIQGLNHSLIQLMNNIDNLQVGFKYNKKIDKHSVDAFINYEYNSFQNSYMYVNNDFNGYYSDSKTTSYLVSFLGQIKYNYAEKYFITINSRLDGSSRFSVSNRWENSPSIGLAWNATNEEFMKNQSLSMLKARISYGTAGQQTYSNNSTVYNANLKGESTTLLNYGIDFGFQNNRVTGSIDFYNRKTNNLLKYEAIPTGSNSNQTILINAGTLNSSGGELTINVIPVMTDKIVWSVSLNAFYQKSIISDYNSKNITLIGFNGVNLITENGYAPAMFYALKQKYNNAGKPIEGSYYDINADGIINYNDYYAYHSATPDCLLGLNSILTYGNWSAGVSFRSSIGNYVYNETNAQLGNSQQNANIGYLSNITTDYLTTGFKTYQGVSDYYIENASFLKMDYFNIGYNFGEIMKNVKLKLAATVQNVFTITGYKGVDPEIPNGIDNGFYPRPRIYSLKINLDY